MYYPSAEGEYYVIVTGEFGCVSEPSDPVHFLFTDIIEEEFTQFAVFPVPAGDHVNISAGESFTGRILLEMNDLMGKVIYSTSWDAAEGKAIRINLKNFPSGIYFISLTSLDSGSKSVRKFIK